MGNPLEVFVGNLSYFCEEQHLYELFYEYSTVTNVRIIRGEGTSKRSLRYGFVAMSSLTEVQGVCRLLNNHLFMGRRLRSANSSSSSSFVSNLI